MPCKSTRINSQRHSSMTTDGMKPQPAQTHVWEISFVEFYLQCLNGNIENSNHHSSAGAIVGGTLSYSGCTALSLTSATGVVGGLAGLSISIVLGVFLRRRRRRRRAMRRSSSAREEGASPHQPGDTTATPDPTPNQPSCQRLYVSYIASST